MQIREKLTEKPVIGIGVGLGILLIAIGAIGYQLLGGGNSAGDIPTQAYYTDDNGKTFFKDDINKVVPFDHNGRQTYRADVFKGPDGKQFVGLVYRHTPIGKHELETYISTKGWKRDPQGNLRLGIEQRGMQVKPVAADEKAWQLNDEYTNDHLRSTMKTPSGGAATLVQP